MNTTDGTLTSTADPNGQIVSYAYDAAKRVTGVTATADGKTYTNAYTYENDRIKTVSHNTTSNTSNDVTYTFAYDELGRKTTVKVGSKTLSTNVYGTDRSGLLTEVQYGNGGKVKYTYDDYDRMTGVKYDSETTDRYTYEYDASGNAVLVRDNNLGRVLQTEHDLTDRPMGTQLRNADGSLIYRTELDYDNQNRLVGFGEEANGSTYKTSYTYDNDNRVTEIGFGGSNKVKYTYDNLGRVQKRIVENGTDAGKLTDTYEFVSGGHGTGSTTSMIAKINRTVLPFEYTYDNRGNIISEKRGTLTTTYAYDALGQLVRVDDPHENVTWVYEYDRGGNMTKRKKYAYTTGSLDGLSYSLRSYTYDSNWKDLLVSNGSYPLTYDAMGNLKTYADWEYEWEAGRLLKKQTQNEKVISYDYDQNGMRIRKTESNTSGYVYAVSNYTYNGSKLVHLTKNSDYMHFFYDNQGRVATADYNGTLYNYLYNLQGDVIAIVDSTGAIVVEYKYNAWGTSLSKTGTMASTLGSLNPFRYRGYIYDEQTWMYWLENRYYYPELHKFINHDSFAVKAHRLLRLNLFSYCLNAPTIYKDPNGLDAICCEHCGGGYTNRSVTGEEAIRFFKPLDSASKQKNKKTSWGYEYWKYRDHPNYSFTYQKRNTSITTNHAADLIDTLIQGSSWAAGAAKAAVSNGIPSGNVFTTVIAFTYEYLALECYESYTNMLPDVPEGNYTMEVFTMNYVSDTKLDSYTKYFYHIYSDDPNGYSTAGYFSITSGIMGGNNYGQVIFEQPAMIVY